MTQDEFEQQESEFERMERERALSTKAEELVQSLNDFVNSGGSHHEMEKVAKNLANYPSHRTLQQSIMKLFIMSIEQMAALPKNRTDGRNEDSRLIAQQMIEGFKLVRAGYDSKLHGIEINDNANPSQYLPFI